MDRKHINKMIGMLFAFTITAVMLLIFPKAYAAQSDWGTTLQQLEELQIQAQHFLQQPGVDESRTAAELTFSYVRATRYKDGVWTLLNRQSDSDFEDYVQQNAPQLAELQTVQSVTIPTTGEEIDFGHLMASCSLAAEGLSIAGGWGGDCMELAETTQNTSADLDSLMTQQAQTFNIEDQSLSVFSAQDLRADMDAVNLAALLQKNDSIADVMQNYYQNLNAGSRVMAFAQNQFGSCDLSQKSDFREQAYTAFLDDEGMQLLLALHDMWDTDNWQLESDAELPLRAAVYLLADYVADTSPQKEIQAEPEYAQQPREENPIDSTPEARPTENSKADAIDQDQAKILLMLIGFMAALCGGIFIAMIIKVLRRNHR